MPTRSTRRARAAPSACAARRSPPRIRTSSRLAGADELVGVGLHAGGDPQQHRRAPRPRGRGPRCGRARRSSRPRSGRRPLEGPASSSCTCCCRGTPSGRRAPRRPAPRGARRRWPRRAGALLVGEAGHGAAEERLGGVGHAARTPRRPPGTGPGGGPRRRRTAACRTRRPARADAAADLSRPSSPTDAVSGSSGGEAARSGSCRRLLTLAHGWLTSTPGRRRRAGRARWGGRSGRLHQPQPGLGQLGLALAHHPAVVVEAVDGTGELSHPGGDAVRRPVAGGGATASGSSGGPAAGRARARG